MSLIDRRLANGNTSLPPVRWRTAFGKMSGLSGRRFLSFPAPPPRSYFFALFPPMPSRAYPAWLEGNGNDCYAGYSLCGERHLVLVRDISLSSRDRLIRRPQGNWFRRPLRYPFWYLARKISEQNLSPTSILERPSFFGTTAHSFHITGRDAFSSNKEKSIPGQTLLGFYIVFWNMYYFWICMQYSPRGLASFFSSLEPEFQSVTGLVAF